MRTVCWFSCGVASAMATKLTLARNPGAIVVRIVIDDEHPDNWRFADDCANWFERPIIELRSEKYKDCTDVWNSTGYLVGPAGARCSTELKKKVRQDFQRPDDVQIFGYTCEEWKRAKHFLGNNQEVDPRFPLIGALLTKEDCLRQIESNGLTPPPDVPHGIQQCQLSWMCERRH